MSLIHTAADIPDILIIEPQAHQDRRGFLVELFHKRKYAGIGIDGPFVQDNLSFSRKGVLRGLHYQLKKPQARLVMALTGTIFDVAVDLRKNSPTFGKWTGTILSAENRCQAYIPKGFAHGFCVLSQGAYFMYKCTEIYDPDDDYGVYYDDPDLNIDWPLKNPILSGKDMAGPRLCEIPAHLLPG